MATKKFYKVMKAIVDAKDCGSLKDFGYQLSKRQRETIEENTLEIVKRIRDYLDVAGIETIDELKEEIDVYIKLKENI